MTETSEIKRSRSGRNFPREPRNWEEVNQRLAYLAEAERQIRARNDDFQRRVTVMKQQCLENNRPLERDREMLQAQIERYYWAHRDELLASGRKTLELTFGRLGSRLSRSVVVDDEEAVLQWLSAHGLRRFLRTHTQMDREAIRSVLLTPSDEQPEDIRALSICPLIRLRESEQFWYEASLPGENLRSRAKTHTRASRGFTILRQRICNRRKSQQCV
ncbi:MAG: host-nuclease inhibitor Gam family protein [Acidobacteria bacterium]|nr:host-nuclease inhibitor Gam family protein [Acidobacteriota bacterium]